MQPRGPAALSLSKAFLIALGAHAAVGVALGFVLCPWLEQMVPESLRHPLDVEVFQIGEKSRNAGVSRPKIPTQPVVRAALPAASVVASPVQKEQAVLPQENSDQLTVEAGGGAQVLSPADYIRWVRTHNAPAEYPHKARILNVTGRAIVEVVVAQSGSPPELVRLANSSGHEILDKAALGAAQAWRYPPFRGVKEKLQLLIPFNFQLISQ